MTRLNDKEYPISDDNGHLVKVDIKAFVTNLHDVMDTLMYEFPTEPTLPLSQADWDKLGTVADQWFNQYKDFYDSYTWNMIDFGYLAQKAWSVAVDPGLKYTYAPGTKTLTQDYVDTMHEELKKLIVLGGQRLFNQIMYIDQVRNSPNSVASDHSENNEGFLE